MAWIFSLHKQFLGIKNLINAEKLKYSKISFFNYKMSERNTKIQIRDLWKIFYGQIIALQDVSLDVYENEFLVIIGPSGCGKTTLLNIIAGLEKPTKGKVIMDGMEITGPDSDRGYVFQQFALFPWKNVYENIEFGLKIKGIPKEERENIVKKFIKLVGLEGFERAYPYQLSGGMQQRVAIARVLANNPKVLLMDEPFGSLDAQTRVYMREELIKIWQKERKTVVFVTHSVDEAIFLADRIVVMTHRPGRIKEIINVNELLPKNRYTDEIVSTPEFMKLEMYVWRLLKEEMADRF